MILPYRRYADFSGRSRRKEYWMFTLFWWIVLLLLMVPMLALGPSGESTSTNAIGALWGLLIVAFIFGSFIPYLAVTVRRFHDQDKSGWMILLNLIPYIGGFIILVFMCTEGTRGENMYGDDPKGSIDFDVFS